MFVDRATDDDLAAYLTRLGVDREPPSVEALFRLHRAQLEAVPYETTWIHLGERWTVDRVASLRRIVHQHRGGYCFHLNGALSLLLDDLGYDVSLHVGGVHRADGPSPDLMTNHLVLQVRGLPTDTNPGGRWWVDAGLGDALHEPLPLLAGTYQQGPFTFGLQRAEAEFADWQFVHRPGGSFAGMAFSDTPVDIGQFAGRHEFLSTSPESVFVNTLTAQRRDTSGVDVLRGVVVQRVEAFVVAEQVVTTAADWFAVLADVFDLPLDDVDSSRRAALWDRVSRAAARSD
jgi:N-hydroxyarylamine O-acetyltransferase